MKEYTRNEIKKHLIMEQLEEKDTSELITLYNEVTGYDDYIWNDIEQMIKDNNFNGLDLVYRVWNAGNDFNPNDDYFKLDGYGNFESFSEYQIAEDKRNELKDYHIDELVEDYESEFDMSELEELEETYEEYDIKEQEYHVFKAYQKKELDDFIKKYIIFAFSIEQLQENAKAKGFDLNKLISIGCGGYIIEEQKDNYIELMKKQSEELKNKLRTDDDFLMGALWFELPNHEYGYTRELEDTFDALGIDAELYESKKAIIDEISDVLIKIDNYIN